MNGIIYIIINRENDKKYVGQTQTHLRKRYPANWWKYCHNDYLKNSVNKYGIEAFDFMILEAGLTTLKKLNERESFYADLNNSYVPKGYNIRKCGDSQTPSAETKLKISNSKSKTYKIKKVTGEIIKIENLDLFCKQHNLNKSAMLNLLCGQSNYSQGFVREETDPNTVKMGRVYSFISPKNEIVNGCISQISKSQNVKIHGLHKLVKGLCKTYYGWRLKS